MPGNRTGAVCFCGRQVESWGDLALTNDQLYWAKTKRLMITCLVIWALASFVVHAFVSTLNEIVIMGFPLGFYMAAQGSLIIFVVLIFWFASRQDAIDREFGVAETE
ncbi:putative solute:sodium symporter small subunit [Constrictibacter sp. MBR-5]